MSAESLVGIWKFFARASICETPPERQAARRCAAYKESQLHKQHIWFLPTQKPTLKKPKELFFANA
jgi:hypothetical protein